MCGGSPRPPPLLLPLLPWLRSRQPLVFLLGLLWLLRLLLYRLHRLLWLLLGLLPSSGVVMVGGA